MFPSRPLTCKTGQKRYCKTCCPKVGAASSSAGASSGRAPSCGRQAASAPKADQLLKGQWPCARSRPELIVVHADIANQESCAGAKHTTTMARLPQ